MDIFSPIEAAGARLGFPAVPALLKLRDWSKQYDADAPGRRERAFGNRRRDVRLARRRRMGVGVGRTEQRATEASEILVQGAGGEDVVVLLMRHGSCCRVSTVRPWRWMTFNCSLWRGGSARRSNR